MKTYDCDKCYAQTESDEDLHLTEHIGCGGTWIWEDGFSMTEPQPIRINAERIAQLEAQLANAERDAWNAAIAAAAARLKEEAARDVWTFEEFTILSNSANKLLQLTK